MMVHCIEFCLSHTSIYYVSVVSEIRWKMFGIPLGFGLGHQRLWEEGNSPVTN